METINQSYVIHAPIAKVWDALVNAKTIEAWGGGPAKMNDKVGTEFTLWGGDIWGSTIEVVEEKRLVQDWHAGEWSEPSKVTFTLKPDGSNTHIELVHENVPHKEVADIASGWKEYYLGAMKNYLEK